MSGVRGLLVTLAACLAYAAGAGAATPKKPATIKDLESQEVPVQVEPPHNVDTNLTMDSYRRFLDLNSGDADLRAEALRRLGDLNLESSETASLERELAAGDGPRAGESIAYYTALLKAYPSYARNDAVLYQLARAYETAGAPEQALATLDQLVARYPRSHYLDEAQFRRGELQFSAGHYPAAQTAYEAVIAIGAGSTFYDQSLYKHGWSLFKQGDSERSLDSFAGVLDALLVSKRNPAELIEVESLSRPNQELIEDTLRVMAITFSYADGPKSLDAFLARSAPRPYAYVLYSRLGDLYAEKQRYTDAADSYRAFVLQDRNHEKAPLLETQAIDAYAHGGFADLVLRGKQEFVENYRFGTAYWQGRDPAHEDKVVQQLKMNLRDLARHFHAQAQKTRAIGDYQEAARYYRIELEAFPDDTEAALTNGLLADTLFDSQQYLDAATEYEHTAYGYADHPRAAEAGYAALVAYGKQEQGLSGEALSEVHARGIDSSLRFAERFPSAPESPRVLARAATELYGAHDYTRALYAADQLLARDPAAEPALQRIAWTVTANTRFDQGEFAPAETAYGRALALMGPTDAERPVLVERLAASIYKEGEQKAQAGDQTAAVDDYLRVAQLAPGSQVRVNADFDAAALLITAQQWDRAIEVLEGFRRNFPTSELQPEVTRKLAVAYSEAHRPAAAAAEFERLARAPGETPELQREALQKAVDLYAEAHQADRERLMLEEFVRRFPEPLNPAIEARARLARMAADAGDKAGEARWQRELIAADRAAGEGRTDRSRDLAAHATLALATPARDAFKAIALVAPLKKSLSAKRVALEDALRAYTLAADYQVAAVTTAAAYESAELYRQLARDLLDSQRPKNLSRDELEQYNVLLEEQAFPFEEKAIKLHEINAARAAEGLYDESVQKSFAALAQLNPGRYGKVEVGEDAGPLAPAQLVEAEAAFTAVLETNAANPVVANELGIVERKLGKFDAAEASYLKAIAADPEAAPAHLNLAILYDLYRADPQRALPEYERYLAIVGQNKQVSGWIAELRKRLPKESS